VIAARSFRSQLLLGAALGVGGLLAIAHLVSMAFIHEYPILIRLPHHALLIAAVLFVMLGVWQVRAGLSPFAGLRKQLAALRDGQERRLEGHYPLELQPLIDDLNALLDQREERVRRAMAKAGDLAHGLKTPLAVMAQEAEAVAAAGHVELAAALSQQVERMRRQVDYHLAQARAAVSGGSPGVRASVKLSAEGLARTLTRLHADRGVAIHLLVFGDHWVRAEREDLDEMLGNLLDNACQWARSRVTLESVERGSEIVVTVDDDGAGLAPSMREAVLQRGVRADETAPGSGLGLAIVRDLAELYGGSISLGDAASGGLRARLVLPVGQGPVDLGGTKA
jgi:signal transduction histidine kinase